MVNEATWRKQEKFAFSRSHTDSEVPLSLSFRIREKWMQEPQGKVLLVDGDLARGERLSGRLTDLGFEVRFADNGATGLLQLHAHCPDVVVIAAELPILDGCRMLRALRSQPQTCDIPAILLTEGSSHRELTQGWSAGADLCISRSYEEAELFSMLQRALVGPWRAHIRASIK